LDAQQQQTPAATAADQIEAQLPIFTELGTTYAPAMGS
jgi:hypothetical protein